MESQQHLKLEQITIKYTHTCKCNHQHRAKQKIQENHELRMITTHVKQTRKSLLNNTQAIKALTLTVLLLPVITEHGYLQN
mgnify:FL=1